MRRTPQSRSAAAGRSLPEPGARSRWKPAALAGALVLALAGAPAAQAQETFRLGVVSFLSGQAAESFGIPAVNGAKVLIEAFNSGQAPAPYDKKGFGGLTIEPIYVDEAGGATKQVQELKNLYDRENVDAVVGYVSSGDCLAVAPAAEEMKRFLILFDCGTPRIFEERDYEYVFRTASHGAMDGIGSQAMLLTDEREVPAVLRSENILDLFPALRAHLEDRGLELVEGDPNAGL